MDATEHVFPCFFLGNPSVPLAAYSPITTPHSLLGLSGVVDKLLITPDGRPGPGAAYGYLIVEKP